MKYSLIFVLLLLSLLLFGCTQKPAENPPAAGELQEDIELTTDLNDFSDLQNSLNDTALDDSGIDENSFS